MGDAGATPPSNGDNGKTEPTTVASLRSAQEAKQRIDESNPIDWTEYAGGDAGDQAARSTAVTIDVQAPEKTTDPLPSSAAVNWVFH